MDNIHDIEAMKHKLIAIMVKKRLGYSAMARDIGMTYYALKKFIANGNRNYFPVLCKIQSYIELNER